MRQVIENHRRLATETPRLSGGAVELIDAVLQPYCEDCLSRRDLVDEIRRIVLNDRSKQNSHSTGTSEGLG